LAQVEPGARPAFVASIKPSASNDAGGFHIKDGRFTAQNVTARFLIAIAYGVQDFQVSGGPGWVDAEHFDIEARLDDASEDLGREPQMIRALLAERFALLLHPETRDSSVYALVAAGNSRGMNASADQSPGGGMSPLGSMNIGAVSLVGTGVPMGLFASLLGTKLGRTVIDQTHLAGRYDVDLRWMPDAVVPDPDASGPDIFTAVQEQLGLKLQASKGPTGFLVIDRIEKPSAN